MERKYDIIFILALALVLVTIISFQLHQFLEYSVFMLCLISYYIGKFTVKKTRTTST